MDSEDETHYVRKLKGKVSPSQRVASELVEDMARGSGGGWNACALAFFGLRVNFRPP